MLRRVLPVRTEIEAKVRKHAVIDRQSPFVLYAVELKSEYSRSVTKRRYDNFKLL